MARALRLLGDPPAPAASVRPVAAKGFRLFFLLAAVDAVAIVPTWLLTLRGVVRPGGAFDVITWHAHEMVFGFAVAVLAGFLLTAVSNWTQRETATGGALYGLAALWLAGRVALAFSAALPAPLVAAIDLAFLPALAAVLARPIVRSKNHRNLVMIAALVALWLTDLAMHLDVLGVLPGWRRRGTLVAVDLVVLVILIIAGRVFPMFTRNATKRESIRSSPALDALTVASMLAVAACDLARIESPIVPGLAALFALARTAHWGARHTAREPLLWVLHLGYLWIPLGLALRSASAFSTRIPAAAATHALTVGALGALTLGMMARVSLGHTGRALAAPRPVVAAFAMIHLAALLRVLAPIAAPGLYVTALNVVGALWTLAFGLFLFVFAPMLVAPRPDGKPG